MTKWQRVKLGNIAEVIGGGTPSTQNYDFWNGDISWLTPKDLSGYKERYISKGERNITASGLQNSSARILPKGTVLLTSRAPIGYLAIAKQEVCTNQGFKSIVLKNGYLPEFFYYLLKNNIEYIIGMSSGSTFSEISGTQVKNLEFKVPPLDVQKKIAGVLGALDDKIELNNKINQNLEAQAQALFKSWFIDFEPFGGKMPIDWKIGKLGDIADITSGKRPLFKSNIKTSNALIPIVGASGVMGYTKEYLYNNKILVTGRVGTHGIIQRFNKTCWPSDNTLIISSNFYEYVYNYLKIIDFSSMNRGSTQPLITQSDLKKCDIIIPSRLFLDKFEKNVSILFDLKDKNTQEIENLAELRDTLLPKLMNGEIDVDNVKID